MPATAQTHKSYKVKDGDCVTSIAKEFGYHWETLWNDPANGPLKQLRVDPNVLKPGDILYIRNKKEKEDPCAAEQRHRFRLLGQPAMLRLRVLNEDVPRANQAYKLVVGDNVYEGVTDPQGKLEHPIPNNAKKAMLAITDEHGAQDVYELKLGGIDPVRDIAGAQQRLFNLGFDPGPIDGMMGPQTESALRSFQKKHNLTETGRLDQPTGAKLVQEHGC